MPHPIPREEFVEGLLRLTKTIAFRKEKNLILQDLVDIAGQFGSVVGEDQEGELVIPTKMTEDKKGGLLLTSG